MPALAVGKDISYLEERRSHDNDSETSDDDEDNDESSLVRLLDSVLDSKSEVLPDLDINLSSLPRLPNFYDFCFNPTWGIGQAPFSRQMAIALNLLSEWCPKCSKRDISNLEDVPLDFPSEDFPSRVQLLEFGVCPKCGRTRRKLYNKGHLNPYVEMNGVAGQRSGKSALLSLVIPYLLHQWVKLERPAQQLGLLNNTILSGTLCGMTFTKACDLLWNPTKNLIQSYPWFSYLHETLDWYGEKKGVELYKFHSNVLNYTFRNLLLHPAGPNKRTLRGDTRFLTVLDELGWFPHGEDNDERERASANEVYVALDRSLKTVRSASRKLLKRGKLDCPSAYSLNISSPSSYYDKIMSLYRTYKGSRQVYVWKLATWEMNPTFSEEDFAKEYLEDPMKADRDFGANPPKSSNPWIGGDEELDKLSRSRNRVKYTYKESHTPSGKRQRYAQLMHGKYELSLIHI